MANQLIWSNQTSDPALWTSFTTPQNKIITLPPRQYLLICQSQKPVSNDQIEDLNLYLRHHHHPASAPEPLLNLTSHFQILNHLLNKNHLYISLTNTSSRKTRQELLLTAMHILQLTPKTFIYQEQTSENEYEEMATPENATLLTGLLQTKQRSTLTSPIPLPPLKQTQLTHLLIHIRPPSTRSSFMRQSSQTRPPPQPQKEPQLLPASITEHTSTTSSPSPTHITVTEQSTKSYNFLRPFF
jgi:hypothetical protein